MLAVSLGRFVRLDENTKQGKRIDVARVLVKTSSWEFIQKVVKIRINGEFFNIRLIEDPYLEYNKRIDDNLLKCRGGISSSSSDDSSSIGDFSLESEMGVSIGSEEEYLIQKLFDMHQRRRDERGEGNQHEGGEKEGRREMTSEEGMEPIIDKTHDVLEGDSNEAIMVTKNTERVKGKEAMGVEKDVDARTEGDIGATENYGFNGERHVTKVNSPQNLFVEIGLRPVTQDMAFSDLRTQGKGMESGPISNWAISGHQENSLRNEVGGEPIQSRLIPNSASSSSVNCVSEDHEKGARRMKVGIKGGKKTLVRPTIPTTRNERRRIVGIKNRNKSTQPQRRTLGADGAAQQEGEEKQQKKIASRPGKSLNNSAHLAIVLVGKIV